MSSGSLPTGTVSPPSQEGTRRSPPATRGDESSASDDELARENERLRRENRHLRERLSAERTERQAIIDRYEGLVDDPSVARDTESSRSTSSRAATSRSTTSGSSPSRPAASPATRTLESVIDRLERFVGLR